MNININEYQISMNMNLQNISLKNYSRDLGTNNKGSEEELISKVIEWHS